LSGLWGLAHTQSIFVERIARDLEKFS
jgi:hypothetical protein